jgi:hypothetical protein
MGGGRGYTSHSFRKYIWKVSLSLPPQQHASPVACLAWIYNNRSRVEWLWTRLKEGRAVATRYEKTVRSFLSLPCLAAPLNWLRSQHGLKLPTISTSKPAKQNDAASGEDRVRSAREVSPAPHVTGSLKR